MKFSPSRFPEMVKIILSLLFYSIILTLINKNILDNNFLNFNVQNTPYLNIFFEKINLKEFILILILIYIMYKILYICFIKLYYTYVITENDVTEYKGIVLKSEILLPVHNLKNIDVLQPSIFQFLTGVRNIGVEVDGMEGYDIVFQNVKNYDTIRSFILGHFRQRR